MLADSTARRLRSPGFERWMHNLAATGYCQRPVRLTGTSSVLRGATGEVAFEYASSNEPDGITFTRCGNRRATRCPSCSREYKGDTWHMIMAGAAGGMKEVPESVASHPMVMLTLTAPSFGAVHSVAAGKRRGSCEHGVSLACRCCHAVEDPQLGDALCAECYDYTGHVVWQYHAPELWRRFTIRLRRELARILGLNQQEASRLIRVQFAKVAEFQRRGIVHFHAIIRLDGVHLVDPYPEPPEFVTIQHLISAIGAAAASTRTVAARLPGDTSTRELRWGKQFDVRPIVRRDGLEGALSNHAVAAYIAKYATKATEDLEPAGVRREHIRRVRATVLRVAESADADGDYAQLRRWEGMLGFRGHFSTKSRRYSVTLGSLRRARRAWRLHRLLRHTSAHSDVGTEDVLVMGSWAYSGMGWLTEGDRALAVEAAVAAREWCNDRARERRIHYDEGETP